MTLITVKNISVMFSAVQSDIDQECDEQTEWRTDEQKDRDKSAVALTPCCGHQSWATGRVGDRSPSTERQFLNLFYFIVFVSFAIQKIHD